MTQNGDLQGSKHRLLIMEEARILGSNFFRCKQYRAAALLYRVGLCVIAPGPFIGKFSPENLEKLIAKDAPEEVDKHFFTLLINLAQALLNIPPRDMHTELAAMDASVACEVANFHLEHILQKWHNISFADFVWQLQHPNCPPKLVQLGGLLAKARSRRSIALERCGNIAGALNDFSDAFGELPAGKTEQDDLESIVLGFENPASGLRLPKEAMKLFSRPLEFCHRAAMDFFEINHVYLKRLGTRLGKMEAAFSCGNYEEGAVFVVSYLRTDNSGGRGYIMGTWRDTGKVKLQTWGAAACTADPERGCYGECALLRLAVARLL
ncbi:hypothetical protein COCOBI_17-2890 [Coccomyxa sp. Obi]|nr:hypothetical protein COCOBI_17-2890 [Coccomyxa sp. Obi]